MSDAVKAKREKRKMMGAVRLATVWWDRERTLAAVVGDYVVHLRGCAAALRRSRRRRVEPPRDMLAVIAGGPGALSGVRSVIREAGRRVGRGDWRASTKDPVIRPVARMRFLAPIPRPTKNVFCIGRNYAEHAKEQKAEVPSVPVFFTKPPTSLIGHDAPVIYDRVTKELDYEVELAVVIGRRGVNIPRAKAYHYVFGYTILIDVTARDLQRRHMQWFRGKSLDTFCPMGPWIVHKSAIPDPHNLRIHLRVNGEVRQQGRTADMVFPIPELLEVLSAGMTLEPGDIVATGTPSGVAAGFDPPRWLRVGDVIEAEIEGIGLLRNPVVAPRS
jgi:2-keto-4-pentenoate hydratase/2-oxohepta-3-ene-1,7-dioic acid hydratase in catechol pathway